MFKATAKLYDKAHKVRGRAYSPLIAIICSPRSLVPYLISVHHLDPGLQSGPSPAGRMVCGVREMTGGGGGRHPGGITYSRRMMVLP